MKKVYIYLRAIEQNEKNRLSLFDTNRTHGVDELVTEVYRNSMVIWELDCQSGIRKITSIDSKTGKRNVFINKPVKGLFSKCVKLYIPENADGEEAYNIEYILENGEKVHIDPYIRVIPPR